MTTTTWFITTFGGRTPLSWRMDISILSSWVQDHVYRASRTGMAVSDWNIKRNYNWDRARNRPKWPTESHIDDLISATVYYNKICPSYAPFWNKVVMFRNYALEGGRGVNCSSFLIRCSIRDNFDSKRDNYWIIYRDVSSCTELSDPRKTSDGHLVQQYGKLHVFRNEDNSILDLIYYVYVKVVTSGQNFVG